MRIFLSVVAYLVLTAIISCSKPGIDDAEPAAKLNVITHAATNIYWDSAVVTASYSGNGVIISETGISYGLQAAPTINDGKVTGSLVNGNLRCVLTGLSSNKTYFARAYYISGNITYYGTQVNLKSSRYPEKLGDNSIFNGGITDIVSDSYGNIFVSGGMKNPDPSNVYYFPLKWNGSSWEKLEQVKSRTSIGNLAAYQNKIYFNTLKFTPVLPLEHWLSRLDNGSFSDIALYNNNNKPIFDICTDNAGNVYVFGDDLNSNNKYYIGKYTPTGGYEQLGNFDFRPKAFCVDLNGNLYVIKFTGTNLEEIVKISGNTVTTILQITSPWEGISIMVTDAQGNLWVSGTLHNSEYRNKVIKWNGNNWTEILIPAEYAIPNSINAVHSLCIDSENNLYLSGTFTNSRNEYPVLKWDGTSWLEITAFKEGVGLLHPLNGKLYMAGPFKDLNGRYYVAEYDLN